MEARACQCRSDSHTRGGARRALVWLAFALLGVGVQVAAQEETAPAQEQTGGQEQIAAVLKQREVDFFYRSSIAPYSCSDLQNRVAVIMSALGARDDVAVTVDRCDTVVTSSRASRGTWPNSSSPSSRYQTPGSTWSTSSDAFGGTGSYGREQSSHVRVRLMMPTVVTPEVLAEMQKDKSRRELVSRVTGNPAAGMNDTIVFPAQRREVTLSHRTIRLEPEDCELLEQMSTSIFRELGLRVVSGSAHCDRRELSHMTPQLTVEALMPVMPATPKIEPGGPSEEGDSGQGKPAASDTKPSEPATP